MKLSIKDISAVKQAEITIDGLTVITGKNDTGKSTILKALFSVIKSDNISFKQKANDKKSKSILATRLNLVFDANITKKGIIKLTDDENGRISYICIKDNNYVEKYYKNYKSSERFFDATFVQSPLVFDLINFFSSVSKMKEREQIEYGLDFDIKYPYALWDLYDKLTKENSFPYAKEQFQIQEIIEHTIKGKFIIEKNNQVYYFKSGENGIHKVEMFNTAMGIKSFGILQLLNSNKFLSNKHILLLDEPEVHLHPEWELKMAELLVKLVAKGISIVITSHSPYMLEALYLFAKENNIENKTNFYLAQDGCIEQQKDLSNIFETLAVPMRELKKIKLGSIYENKNR